MSAAPVDKLARALLYEGYVLYPYRPSVKNQQRWTFGGVYPPAWSLAQEGADACAMQTQCLVESGPAAVLRIKVRFLHLVDRAIGRLASPVESLSAGSTPEFELVPSIEIGGRQYQSWQEAVEREIDLGDIPIDSLLRGPRQKAFSFPQTRTIEPLAAPDSPIVAILIRCQESIEGRIILSARMLADNLIRLTVRVINRTEMTTPQTSSRDHALMRSLVSTHTILGAVDASLVSLTDPPPHWKDHAGRCQNIGAWPVMVGTPGERHTMLSSPIIIEDYPKIAPESPGDLFDSSEIDEILTLRILTLTEEEKRLAAGVDDRVRDLLARTELLARDQLMGLHASMRQVDQPVASSATRSHGGLKIGDRVRLRPLGRGDVMDIALDGKSATIVSIDEDFEDRVYVSVTIDDDPGRDLGATGQPGHRFFFGSDEVEPLATEAAL